MPELPVQSDDFPTWVAATLLVGAIGLLGVLVRHLASQQNKDRTKLDEVEKFQRETLVDLVTKCSVALENNQQMLREGIDCLKKAKVL